MTTTQQDITEMLTNLSNDTLAVVFHCNGRTVRDAVGNLRELTEEEKIFIKATRAEMTRRGLL